MILTPRPKPVRIRIKSGGQEHGTLDSLKARFVFDEILPLLKDGRISRWLRQSSLPELADKIDILLASNPEETGKDFKYRVYSVLFNNDTIKNEFTLLCALSNDVRLHFVFMKEMEQLPVISLTNYHKKGKKAIPFWGYLCYFLAMHSNDLDKKCQLLVNAVDEKIEEAIDPLAVAWCEQSSSQHRKDNLQVKEFVEKLIVEYDKGMPTSPSVFLGPYTKYYNFFAFSYRLRNSNNVLFFYHNSANEISIFQKSKELKAALSLIDYGVNSNFRLSSVPTILPRDVPPVILKAFKEAKGHYYFSKAIDVLCRNFWEYLVAQNENLTIW